MFLNMHPVRGWEGEMARTGGQGAGGEGGEVGLGFPFIGLNGY